MKKPLFRKTTVALLICVLVFTIVGTFIRPKRAQALFGEEALVNQLIEFIKKSTLSIFKSGMMDVIRNARIRYLTGRSDVPLFPSDIGKYSEDAGIEAIRLFVHGLSDYDICGATKAGVTFAALEPLTMPDYKKPLIPPCTAKEEWKRIAKGEAELSDYITISSPENNFFGVYLMATDAIDRKKDVAKAGVTTDLVTSQGYLGVKDCKEREAHIKECKEANMPPETTDKCISLASPCETKTPGSAIFGEIDKMKGAPMDQFIATEDWDQTIGLIMPVILDATVATLWDKLYQEGVKAYEESKK